MAGSDPARGGGRGTDETDIFTGLECPIGRFLMVITIMIIRRGKREKWPAGALPNAAVV